MHSRPQATPTPQLRFLHQSGRQRISLYVAQERQEVIVALNGKTLETPLIEVSITHGPVRNAPTYCVRVRQPSEEIRHLTVLFRPDNKVPVIRQNTIGQDADGLPMVRLHHHPLERLEVGLLAKHMHPPDRSVQDVINLPSRRDPSCSWHNNNDYQNGRPGSILIASRFGSPSRFGSRFGIASSTADRTPAAPHFRPMRKSTQPCFRASDSTGAACGLLLQHVLRQLVQFSTENDVLQ